MRLPCLIGVAALLPLALTSCSGGADEEAIKRCYALYQDALIRKDGDAVLAVVDSNTIAQHDTLLERAKNMTRPALEMLPVAERMQVLITRVRLNRARLATLTGADLVKLSITEGWTASQGAGAMRLTSINIDGDTAKAKISHEAQLLRFRKENGEWLLDQSYTLEVLNSRLENSIRKRGLKENDMVAEMMKQENDGKDPPAKIWDGPLD